MRKTLLPNIETVKPGDNFSLCVKFRGRGRKTVDLGGFIAREDYLAPLRDKRMFDKVKVIDWGAAVGWPGDLDIGASSLWHMAEEQRPFTSADFVLWQSGTGLSNAEAADALGLSIATIKNYRAGAAIPAAVAIACRAMAAEPITLAAHFRPRKAGRPKAA